MRATTRSRTNSFVRLFMGLIVTAVVLAGCGGVTGTYEAKAPDGEGSLAIELKSGGIAVVAIDFGAGPDSVMRHEGTYTVNGDKVAITFDGDTETFTLKDGELTGSAMGETLTLKKK